mmetsp:Transcript_44110/g.147105  ORF Transcript_44110/g.147105 Transcript_44110/m.147105 type:complete len:152 (+) Transcript_44110:57-512(+)
MRAKARERARSELRCWCLPARSHPGHTHPRHCHHSTGQAPALRRREVCTRASCNAVELPCLFPRAGGRWRVASRPLRNESLAAALLPPASEARHSALGSILGGLLLALCAVLTLPQVVRAIKRSRGVSTGFAPGYVRAGGVMMSPMPLTSP